jgi:hypothetical protein
MIKLTLVLAYYMNSSMLKMQFDTINEYSEEVKKNLQVIVVDDGSPVGHRAEEAIEKYGLKANGFDFELYRIMTDLKWNQDGARNLGADRASNQWLLLTDIDHLIYPRAMEKIMGAKLNIYMFYTFTRLLYPDMGPKKAHPNSYLMTKQLYWQIGGYDEIYCGHYGTDGIFRRTCDLHAKCCDLKIPLVLVGRSDVPDASTTTLTRKDPEDKNLIYNIRHFKNKNSIPSQKLKLPWKKIEYAAD